jgi:hypothetical protein
MSIGIFFLLRKPDLCVNDSRLSFAWREHRALGPMGAPIGPAKPIPFHVDGPTPLLPERVATPQAASVPSVSAIMGDEPSPRAESANVLRLLGTSAEEEELYCGCFQALSWEERLMGFAGCYAIGLALTLSSLFSFPALLLGDPSFFAWKYSVGNVIGLAGSAFLVGPHAQLESMTSPVRIGATAAYIASIFLTVFFALVLHQALLTLCAMAVQFCALAWYCASYVPFGRMCIQQCVGKLCCPV